ncbi:serine O-acetyltransferase [Aerosakkonemataceae cyanobacterium BLCC-F50]|uniref:serine O-acetyltransferase n=1 Tax=Floridaenema flaviceps BLCC-F50 TaxID=3153642 RepID=A0ABV4Y1V3_9CYAN
MTDVNLYRSMLLEEIHKILNKFLINYTIVRSLNMENIINDVLNLSIADLRSFVQRDPSAMGSFECVISSYLSFKAVMYYRLANRIFYSLPSTSNQCIYLQAIARQISEEAKLLTGIEIHPAATIGSGLVIDHGLGTLIGETCEIGNNCYLLQSVLLGAIGIADNERRKRHPTLGNNIKVGAFAKILGSIKIGDNVEISPGSIIYKDIPSDTRVIVTNELQIHNTTESNLQIYGIILENDGKVCIAGKGLESANFYLLDIDNIKFEGLAVQIYERNDQMAKICIKNNCNINRKIKKLRLCIQKGASEIIISNSLALRKLGISD